MTLIVSFPILFLDLANLYLVLFTGLSWKLQQLGVEGLIFLGLGIGDEDALKLQQSPGQVINFLPASDASGVNCLTISVSLILKYIEKCNVQFICFTYKLPAHHHHSQDLLVVS